MGRTSGVRSKYRFVSGDDLDSVVLDEDEKTRDASTLLELTPAPLGDPVLVALRRALTLTYDSAETRSSEECLREIRAIAIPALGELGNELEALRLPRVDADPSFRRDRGAKVFMYLIVPNEELSRKVKVDGKGRKVALRGVIPHLPADAAIQALRRVLSLTFEEATTPTQHDRILEDVRFVAAEALAPCNELLEAIEVEPVAVPTVRRFIDGVDTFAGDQP